MELTKLEKREIKAKAYRDAHKDETKIRNKNYYAKYRIQIIEKKHIYNEKNKEKQKIQKSELLNCECGNPCSRNNISRHNKSSKHLYLMGLINTFKNQSTT